MEFKPRCKFLFIGSFILSQLLIDRILLRPVENGFNTAISEQAMDNLYLLASLLHGIFSEVMYDTFKEQLMEKKVLQTDESNKKEILHEYIYDRYRYYKRLPKMEDISYAYADTVGGEDSNEKWWKEMKEKCSKFIVLIFKIMEKSSLN